MTAPHKYPYAGTDTSAPAVARAWVTCSGQNTAAETATILRGQTSAQLAVQIKESWDLPRSCTNLALVDELRKLQAEFSVRVK